MAIKEKHRVASFGQDLQDQSETLLKFPRRAILEECDDNCISLAYHRNKEKKYSLSPNESNGFCENLTAKALAVQLKCDEQAILAFVN